MKKIIFILSLFSCLSIAAHAEDDKTVTLTVSGTGATKEVATQNALRSAIEQAFGVFISSKTEVLNDILVKDEIVSVTNGNIQKYDIVSEVQIPEGGTAITLKAIVSVTKLTSFCESKGITVEFKGGLFAADIKNQILNEKSEVEAVQNLCKVSQQLLNNSFDIYLNVSDPISIPNDSINFLIPINLKYVSNHNINILYYNFISTLKQLSMCADEVVEYKSLNKPIQFVTYEDSIGQNLISLRNPKSAYYLKYFAIYSNRILFDFKVVTDVDSFKIGFRKDVQKDSIYNINNVSGKYHTYILDKNEVDVWYLDSLNSVLNFGSEYGTFTSSLYYYLYWNRSPQQFREEYSKMLDLKEFWNNYFKDHKNLSQNLRDHMVSSMIYDANRLHNNIYKWEVSSLSPEMDQSNVLVLKFPDKIGSISINHKLSINKIEKIRNFKVLKIKNNSLL
jgi:hypothetical protein